MSRIDIAYAVMRLCGYNLCLTNERFKTLRHFMSYLYHHPHIPLMYKHCNLCKDNKLHTYMVQGCAEYYEKNNFLLIQFY